MNHEEKAATASIDETTAAIRQVVAEAEKYQSDLDRFIALHTPDVVLVNIAGRRVLGRDALQRAMKQALESPLANVFTRQEIEDIRFVRPDVAIVSCIKHVSDERIASSKDDPSASLPLTGSLTFVLVQEQNAWRIASAQTTPIRTP